MFVQPEVQAVCAP